jgi:hypothetical protein
MLLCIFLCCPTKQEQESLTLHACCVQCNTSVGTRTLKLDATMLKGICMAAAHSWAGESEAPATCVPAFDKAAHVALMLDAPLRADLTAGEHSPRAVA